LEHFFFSGSNKKAPRKKRLISFKSNEMAEIVSRLCFN
jgi:hypothetical protein